MRTSLLCGAAALGLAALLPAGTAQAQNYGETRWFGSVYIKFLDGNRNQQNGLQNNAENNGGDLGQGIEFDLNLRNQVSRQVEVGARIQSRFNKNYWSNFGGFGGPFQRDDSGTIIGLDGEADPLQNQYIKLRGAFVRLTPGYDWLDSVFIGTSDFGLWDPMTVGKIRYIDRDNAAGVILQGTLGDGAVRWDAARISLPKLWAGPNFNTGDLFANDAGWVAQAKVAVSSNVNISAITMLVDDNEVDETDPDARDGRDLTDRYNNFVGGLKGQFNAGNIDVSAAAYYSSYDVDEALIGCTGTGINACRWTPVISADADDWSGFLNIEINDILPDFSIAAQLFHIGADYTSVLGAKRESDVLLTEGREGAWAWERPFYSSGSGDMNFLGYGGWNGHMDQVAVIGTDNAFTDFDERAAESVIGWQGATVVPRLTLGDLELQGELSYITFDTNWQGCGGSNAATACVKYPRLEGLHSWGVGGDLRSPYAPFQDKTMYIAALNASYLLDVGDGVQLGARLKYIRDEDNRVTDASRLGEAYGNTVFGVGDDDREADYYTAGFSAGYQLTSDLFGRFVYEWQGIDLVDGTVNVTPPGAESWEVPFGWAEYMTGEHSRNKFALQGSYFLSGVEVGADVQWIFGEFTPEFRAGTNAPIQTDAQGRVITPWGPLSRDTIDFEVYRLKIFTKVQF